MGVSAVEVNPDLQALIAGGDAFLKRVAELKSAQSGYEKALSEFNLGSDTMAAFKSAKEKEEAAVKTLNDAIEQAGSMLEDARKQSDQIINEAHVSASNIISDTQAQMDAAKANLEHDVKVGRESLLAWTADQEGKINADRSEAAKLLARAEAQVKANKRAAEELEVAQKAAKESQAKADAATKVYTDKFNKLNAALNGV